jgi:type I restriction enzyme S subunit
VSLPTYSKYTKSGVGWLGEVPERWKIVRLKNLAHKIGSGKTPLGGNEVYVADGVLFLRSQNVYDDGLHLDDSVFIASEVDESMKSTRVNAGDILLNVTGASIGRSCLVPDPFVPANVNQHVCIIRISDHLQRKFVAQVMKADVVKNQVALVQNGAAREGLNFEQIGNLVFAIPLDTCERSAIIDFLDRETGKIDALVEEQRRLIELLKEKRQAVISHAVTKGLNPNVPLKHSGIEWLGKVPEHWETLRLGRLFREVNEDGHGSLPILSVSIHDGVSNRQLGEDEVERKVTRSEDKSKYKAVAPEDLVYNMMRAWQGGFGSVTVSGLVSPAYVVARPIRAFSSPFVELMLRTSCAVEEMRRHSQGVTDFRLRLYWDNFKSIEVALPPPKEQEEIMAHIQGRTQQIDDLIAESETGIALLQERGAALISAAVTGKIDVRGQIEISVA